MLFVKENTQGLKFKVWVQPRSSTNMIAGLHGDALKIKLTAPPVDNAANKMCIQFLSKYLRVPKSSLSIVSGHTSRTKWVFLRYKNKEASSKTEQDRIKRLLMSVSPPPKTA